MTADSVPVIAWVALIVCGGAALLLVYVIVSLLIPKRGQKMVGNLMRNIDNVTHTLSHTLTPDIASRYTEEEARRIYGDEEVDRYLRQERYRQEGYR